MVASGQVTRGSASPGALFAEARQEMVVITPTYAPDLELFADLHESVLRWFPSDVRHVVAADDRDLRLFRRFESARCEVVSQGDVLPRSVWALPFSRLWLNVRWPVPPLRGWIVQQLVKLALADRMREQVIVLADSDVVFVRPVTVRSFAPDGRVRFYRKDDGVDLSLPRHLRWHAVARRLLGLPPSPRPAPLPDYISPLNSWDRSVVSAALRRIESITGRPWVVAVGKELHFSEFILYGLYADELEQAGRVALTDDSLCHSYWETAPLADDGADEFLSALKPQDVAYAISAKSSTPVSVRRAARARLSARVEASGKHR